MKTKEKQIQKTIKSSKQNKGLPISDTNVDYDEVKRKLNNKNQANNKIKN